MKKINYPILTIISSILFFTSCSKKENIKNVTAIVPIDNIEYNKNNIPAEYHAYNEKDKDDEKINLQLLELTLELRKFYKNNPQFAQIVKNETNKQQLNSLKLIELFESNTLLKSMASKDIIKTIKNINLEYKSKNPLKYGEIEKYTPGIYIPNLKTADFSKSPFICPGFEVNSDLTGMKNYEDYIIAWYFDKKLDLHEFLLNEQEAMKASNPVFIINKMITEEIPLTSYNQKENSPPLQLKSTNTTYGIETNEYKINYRYEASGNSELCIAASVIDENLLRVYNILRDNNSNLVYWKEIAEVSKNEIGMTLSHWEQFCEGIQPNSGYHIFWNTFERDWYASEKSLGSASITVYPSALPLNPTILTVSLQGRMKYSSEWYAFNPNDLEDYPLEINTIFTYWSKTYNLTKSYLKFWKVAY